MTRRKRAEWSDEPLLHGTSTKALADLRKAKRTIASGLFLTDDENTAYEYAFEAARRWGGEPVIVKVSTAKLKKAGGKLWYDADNDEIIIEQMVYEGPLPAGFILDVERLKPEPRTPTRGNVERIGPMQAASPVRPVIAQDNNVTSPTILAKRFFGIVEGNENSGAYDTDKRVPVLVAALARVGVREIKHILGSGSFGVAALTVDGHVVKLTGDTAEVQVGAHLVGKNLPHVVAIYGSWYVRGPKINVQAGWNEKEQEIIYKLARVGILMEQKVVAPDSNDPARQALTRFVFDWKEKTLNRFEDYAHLSAKAKREKLHAASYSLQNDLRARAKLVPAGADNIFQDVSDAVGELRDVGVYAVDVHGGNIGFDEKTEHYRIFDVGVGSPPPDAPQPEAVGPGGGGTGQRQEATRPGGRPIDPQRSFGFEVAEAVAPPMEVGEI